MSGDSRTIHQARIALLSIHLGGHRRSYVDLFSKICADAGLTPVLLRSWASGAQHHDPLLVLMIEESFVSFVRIALGRAFRGRSTAGLLFGGAGLVNNGGVRAILKRCGLRLLTLIPSVTVLAITPFAVVPGLEKLADGWIYDPQLWDVESVPAGSSSLAADVRKVAAGRTVVAALGRQGAEKGFDRFVRLWRSRPDLRERCLFVSAGNVDDDLQPEAEAFRDAGGYLVDRFISDGELMSLYGVCDMVWAVYDPIYDQSSGVMGRAIQLGRPAVVRWGSQIHDLARHLDVPVVAARWDDDAGIEEAILSSIGQPVAAPTVAPSLKAHSLEVLHRYVLAGGAETNNRAAV